MYTMIRVDFIKPAIDVLSIFIAIGVFIFYNATMEDIPLVENQHFITCSDIAMIPIAFSTCM